MSASDRDPVPSPEDRLGRDVARLLEVAAPPARPDAGFEARLFGALAAEAASVRGAPSAAARVGPFGAFLRAAAATIVAGLGLFAADAAVRGAAAAPVRVRYAAGGVETVSAPLAADRAAALWLDGGGRGRADVAHVAELELGDGAAARFRPSRAGAPAALDVVVGRFEIEAASELEVRAADLTIAVHPGTRLEVAVVPLAESAMKNEILSAAGGVVLGAAAVGLLLKNGSAELNTPHGDPAALARGRASVSERPLAEDPASELARLRDALKAAQEEASNARVSAQTLRDRAEGAEKALDAAKKDAAAAREAAADKKVAEIGKVMAQIEELKKKGLSALIDPRATADLLANLKALGPAGTHAMLGLLGSADETERFLAAQMLENLGDPAAIDALKGAALDDSSDLVMRQASHAIALMDNPAIVGPCKEIYESSKSDTAKVNALFGWARFGDEKGMAEAVSFVTDKKRPEMLRHAIGQGFLLMTDDKTMTVADAYVDANRTHAGLMDLAVKYYGRFQTPAARNRLRILADDPQVPQAARDAAQAALSK